VVTSSMIWFLATKLTVSFFNTRGFFKVKKEMFFLHLTDWSNQLTHVSTKVEEGFCKLSEKVKEGLVPKPCTAVS